MRITDMITQDELIDILSTSLNEGQQMITQYLISGFKGLTLMSKEWP